MEKGRGFRINKMSVSLKHEDLAKALVLIQQNPSDESKKIDFINLVQPIIRLTVDKFSESIRDDMSQEIRMFFMKRADYISTQFFQDKITNPTNYLFRVAYNSAMNFIKREAKNSQYFIPIDDLKIEPIYKHKSASKSKVVDDIREKCLDFIRLRYTDKGDRAWAEKLLLHLLEGKRPTFEEAKFSKITGKRKQTAKDIYSVVLLKLRELAEMRIEELTE